MTCLRRAPLMSWLRSRELRLATAAVSQDRSLGWLYYALVRYSQDRQQVLDKLELANRVQIALFAVREGLISVDEAAPTD